MKSIALIIISLIFSSVAICAHGAILQDEAQDIRTVQRNKHFMPLGVYWAGEHTFNDQIPELRWKQIDRALDDLAAHHVNAIWLTHLSTADMAEFARRAAGRNMYVVASIGGLAFEEASVRKANHRELVSETLRVWADAPLPIAWGLGDEPRASYMDEMADYIRTWKRYAPSEPVTAVIMPRDLALASRIGFDVLVSDIYPFFSTGNPHLSSETSWDVWQTRVHELLRYSSARAWIVAQAYQEPWGPCEYDEQGNIVYLPGSGAHWVMPSPAQIKWQAWTAIAAGAKGIFYFLYRYQQPSGSHLMSAVTPPHTVKERTNSGSPRGLVYERGRATPQYEALGEAFAKIAKLEKLLAPLKPAPFTQIKLQQGDSKTGVATQMVDPDTGKCYLVVVAPYDADGKSKVSLFFGPQIKHITNLITRRRVRIRARGYVRSATVTLPPGEGAAFECGN